MDEKNLKIIRYLTGAMFLALALTCIPSILSNWNYGFIWLFVCILSFVGALLSAFSMFSKTYSLLAVGAGMLALHDLIYIFMGGAIYRNMKTDNRIEELTKLKDLLDTGVITREEFDAKKQQLLQI